MLIEIFILIEILALGAFALSWFGKNPIMWAVSVIIFGIQIITAFNIEFYIHVVSVGGQITTTVINHSSIMAYINMIFFFLSLVMFFWDIYNERN